MVAIIGRLKEAEELYLESIQLTPDQATTYNNLGKCNKIEGISSTSMSCPVLMKSWAPV